jgi:hypothetical protein
MRALAQTGGDVLHAGMLTILSENLKMRIAGRLRYYDASNYSNNITTAYHYNWRNQLRGIEPPAAPYTVNDVDFEGRAITTAKFTSDPTWSSVLTTHNYASTTSTNRGTLSTTAYDSMDRVYQTSVWAINSSTGAEDDAILTNTYYDRSSNRVASVTSGQASMEYAYDGANRQYQTRTLTALNATLYNGTTGAFQYQAPVPSPVFSSMSGGNAGVLELHHQALDGAGDVLQNITLLDNHDDTSSVGLDIGGTDYVQTEVYSWYDAGHRITYSANLGTGTSSWTLNTTFPSYSTVISASTSSALVTGYAYYQGRLQTVTAPKGDVTKYFYDSMDRKT